MNSRSPLVRDAAVVVATWLSPIDIVEQFVVDDDDVQADNVLVSATTAIMKA